MVHLTEIVIAQLEMGATAGLSGSAFGADLQAVHLTEIVIAQLEMGATAGLSGSDFCANSYSTAGQAGSGTQVAEELLLQRAVEA
ncbi:MAG TPA: hypothetical protein VMY37_38345 [Thermoguttaceae bacterium]|nr:hypothetical protein [Thermoguttaceae bacterium]